MNIQELTGLEFMTKIKDGEIKNPPIANLIPMKPILVEKGKVIFRAIASKEHFNPAGTVHGGFLATLIDTASSCAVHTTLEKGEYYGTIDLNVKMIRPIPIDVEIFGEGVIINRTKNIGFANCTVKDKEGKIYGYGSSTCMIKSIN
jgi:uncharacterized protein (TIGR00369 family)